MEMPLHPSTVGSFPESSGGGAEGDIPSGAAPHPRPRGHQKEAGMTTFSANGGLPSLWERPCDPWTRQP